MKKFPSKWDRARCFRVTQKREMGNDHVIKHYHTDIIDINKKRNVYGF